MTTASSRRDRRVRQHVHDAPSPNGKRIKTDCSVNSQIQGKTYCFEERNCPDPVQWQTLQALTEGKAVILICEAAFGCRSSAGSKPKSAHRSVEGLFAVGRALGQSRDAHRVWRCSCFLSEHLQKRGWPGVKPAAILTEKTVGAPWRIWLTSAKLHSSDHPHSTYGKEARLRPETPRNAILLSVVASPASR